MNLGEEVILTLYDNLELKYLLLTVQIWSFALCVFVRVRVKAEFILKAEAHNYGKGRYISDAPLRCSDNHNAMCQLANRSRLCLSEGGTL